MSINRINNSDDIQTLLAMISSGIGISILPESTILLGVENIKTIPLSGKYVTWSVGMVWNDKIENKARDLFLKTFDIE
ncbi:hypothetical protein FHQ19_12390 [Pasteurellaceae bacterium UScroc12]|nr:hypothetical protein FHQ19_12390 [Pasteurellaceae bacterium UScroc12]